MGESSLTVREGGSVSGVGKDSRKHSAVTHVGLCTHKSNSKVLFSGSVPLG